MWVVVVRVKRKGRPVVMTAVGPFTERWRAVAVLHTPTAQRRPGEKWREVTVVDVEGPPC